MEKKEEQKGNETSNFNLITNGFFAGIIIIIFTIFFLGSINVKYNLNSSFNESQYLAMEKMGYSVGSTFSTIFNSIYNIGGKQSNSFFYIYILIIFLVI